MHLQRAQRIPDAMVLTGETLRSSWILKVESLICCKSEAALTLPIRRGTARRPSPVQPYSLVSQSLELNSESVMMGSPKQPLASVK